MHEYAYHRLDALLDRQKEAWLAGSRPCAEEFLQDAAFQNDAEVLLDLIYNEIVLREELEESPTLEEYVERYPHLEEALRLHFEIHGALNKTFVGDTPQPNGRLLEIFEPPEEAPPPQFADYDILGELGRGGMGIVYQARHRGLKRVVALKMFKPGRLPSARELTRFQTEAEAVARLQHPNIVQIFEVGQTQGLPFLALEYSEQGTLADRLRDLPFTSRDAAELIETLARAIHHAHERHIVHRDLKPANVLFTKDGVPKITDFGLAKLLAEDAARDATRSGEPLGTPRYMSPEQAAGRPEQIGPATDIYALGTILYECLTGQVPFVSASVVETIDKIRHDEPVPPRRWQRSIPRDLQTICLTCLHKQPQRRYASARALADDLRRFRHGEPIHARPTPPWERAWMWCRRRPALATLLAASFALLVAGLIVFWVRHRIEEQRLAKLREVVAGLMKVGHQALARGEVAQAKEKFLEALAKTSAEPALRADELGIRGWFDQSLRDGEQQRLKQRRPPPLFDERRDEAMALSLILAPRQPESAPTARAAIAAALELTIADDPAWRREREQLILLDADMIQRGGDAAAALARLDQVTDISSRLWRQRRAEYLERLGRKAEADQERADAQVYPPTDALAFFWSAVDRLYQRDLAGAVGAFDKTLMLEPDHFTARFLQAACFLQLHKPTEAKVALTACLAQRPGFAWNYLFRGQAFAQLGEQDMAAEDYQRALDMNPTEPVRRYLGESLDDLRKRIHPEGNLK